MRAEQLEAMAKQARHNIKIHINRVAKQHLKAMRQAWKVAA